MIYSLDDKNKLNLLMRGEWKLRGACSSEYDDS